jgi:SPP1 gp7 family putative phage head morphogenesis protein
MTDFRAFYTNERSADPTRTLTLRSRWTADWNRRIAALQKAIKTSVVDNDGFGLEEKNKPFMLVQAFAELPPLTPAPMGKWAYRWSHEKVSSFMAWLREMEERSLLQITNRSTLRPGGEPWSNQYVQSAYQMGLSYAMDNVRRRAGSLARDLGIPDIDLPPSFRSVGDTISALMNQPFHADRLALAYTRVFDELKGVTAAMDQQISRVLSEGLAQGLNPRDIGAKIADRVEKIGGTRGRLIARTEVINVHQQAALNEYYATENATGEVVLIEWNATMDARTRDTHAERHGRVYTKEEAYALIGEPNCRCALLPYIPAVQGIPKKATQAARYAAGKAITESKIREKKEGLFEPEKPLAVKPVPKKPPVIKGKTDRDILSGSPITGHFPLGGGANVSEVLELGEEFGSKKGENAFGVFKPVSGEDLGVRYAVDVLEKFPLAAREVLASDIAESIGMSDLVPATVFRKVKGEIGSFQKFVPTKGTIKHEISTEDWVRSGVFDYLIGNSDRHSGNILFDLIEEGKRAARPVLIDNGFAFPDDLDSFRTPIVKKELTEGFKKLRGKKKEQMESFFKEVLDGIDEEKIKSLLTQKKFSDLGFEMTEDQINATLYRVKDLLKLKRKTDGFALSTFVYDMLRFSTNF